MQIPSTIARELMGDIAPKFAELTDTVLFDDIWQRPVWPRVTQPDYRCHPDRAEPQRAIALSHAAGTRQRHHPCRTGRGHHPSGVLCGMANGGIGCHRAAPIVC